MIRPLCKPSEMGHLGDRIRTGGRERWVIGPVSQRKTARTYGMTMLGQYGVLLVWLGLMTVQVAAGHE